MRPGSFWPWFAVIIIFAFGLRLALAVMLPNLERPDEVFQNLEPAFRMWSGHGIVTWEWREGIRSPLFPGFLAGVIGIASLFGGGSGDYLAAISTVLSFISVGTVAIGMVLGWRLYGLSGAVVCGVLCAVWPDLVYLGPKPLSEVQAGNLLAIAAYLAASARPNSVGTPSGAARVAFRMFLAGLFLGLVFCLRFQLAPALLVTALWAGRLEFRRRWLFLVLGGLLPIALLGIVDFFYWGSPFQSVWRNIQVNLLQGVSTEYGVQPVYFYGTDFLRLWGAQRSCSQPLSVSAFAGRRCSA